MSRINTVEGAFSYESDISYMRNTADLPQAHKATAFHWKKKQQNIILVLKLFLTPFK